MSTFEKYDAVGIGAGPSNLSVAALLAPVDGLSSRFFEKSPRIAWHEGLLFPFATIQVSFLKDLVTPIDPTSRYSFLSFLAEKKRLYRFLHAGFERAPRWQFSEYFAWAAEKLGNVTLGVEVVSVEVAQDLFLVELSSGERILTRNLILGTGQVPYVPPCVVPHLDHRVILGHRFRHAELDPTGRSIAVIGGGQTGAEIVSQLLADDRRLPARLHWITRRPTFAPLDESPFANELFTPSASDRFYGLPPEQRTRELREQKLLSDGISLPLLDELGHRVYELEFRLGVRPLQLRAGEELIGLERRPEQVVMLSSGEEVEADTLVLATGFEQRLPPALRTLEPRFRRDAEGIAIAPDYSVEWDGPAGLRIFLQNGARGRRGIADPNLSLVAWRGAVICNSLAQRSVYDVTDRPDLYARTETP